MRRATGEKLAELHIGTRLLTGEEARIIPPFHQARLATMASDSYQAGSLPALVAVWVPTTCSHRLRQKAWESLGVE